MKQCCQPAATVGSLPYVGSSGIPIQPIRIRRPSSAANIAQSGACLAVALRTKSEKTKSLVGSACGALCCYVFNLAASSTGVTGIFGILLHLHMPLQYIIMMAISFGVSFAVTWLIWSPEEVKA